MNTRKPDFSNVDSNSRSTETPRDKTREGADFGNVRSTVRSSEELLGGSGDTTHTVVPGESLSKIAKRYYGKASKWKAIYDANRDQLDNPDLIHPGQVLKIPGDA